MDKAAIFYQPESTQVTRRKSFYKIAAHNLIISPVAIEAASLYRQ